MATELSQDSIARGTLISDRNVMVRREEYSCSGVADLYVVSAIDQYGALWCSAVGPSHMVLNRLMIALGQEMSFGGAR